MRAIRVFLCAVSFLSVSFLCSVDPSTQRFVEDKTVKVYVAGHSGLVGSALVRALKGDGYTTLVTREENELDLTNQAAVNEFFNKEKPEYVIVAAAKVGGIWANKTQPVEFGYINGMIALNVLHAAHENGVKKLLFLGSSCIYPRECGQPMKPEYLETGALEPTNDAYARAKIMALTMCQNYKKEYGDNFISAMPTNLYGPGDNFHEKYSHVLPALLRRFHEAKVRGDKQVVIWGTGVVYREFLHVDDCAQACLFLMKNYDGAVTVNVGTGQEVTIKELVTLVKEAVGFKGELVWDATKPDGMPRKLLDVSEINKLGWKAQIDLRSGLESFYRWYVANEDKIRK